MLLDELERARPGVPALGGLASAAVGGGGVLLQDGEVRSEGAVAALISGMEVLPCVSQGAMPVGPEMTVTAAEANVIGELASRPAMERLGEVIEELPGDERELAAGGVLLGIVVDENRPEYLRGDFLVRPIVGADRETGALAIGQASASAADGAAPRPRRGIGRPRAARGAATSARRWRRQAPGALLFTCNGRGTRMFAVPDHDAGAIAEALGPPSAGFFCPARSGPSGARISCTASRPRGGLSRRLTGVKRSHRLGGVFRGNKRRMPRPIRKPAICLIAAISALSAAASANAADTFAPTGNLVKARGNAVAVPLPGGRVLVYGGTTTLESSSGVVNSAEVYDPSSGRFTELPTAPARAFAAAAPLQDGRVLIAGGKDAGGVAVATAEIYDPQTNSSTPVGAMGTPRSDAVAAPLPDGRVLVAGGITGSFDPIVASAEIFDPGTNTFSAAGIGPMQAPRAGAAASRLPDGRVLVAGGRTVAVAADLERRSVQPGDRHVQLGGPDGGRPLGRDRPPSSGTGGCSWPAACRRAQSPCPARRRSIRRRTASAPPASDQWAPSASTPFPLHSQTGRC